jgi:hypothetical protein
LAHCIPFAPWSSFFLNCLWNGPWTTIRRIVRSPPYTSFDYSSLKLRCGSFMLIYGSKMNELPFCLICAFTFDMLVSATWMVCLDTIIKFPSFISYFLPRIYNLLQNLELGRFFTIASNWQTKGWIIIHVNFLKNNQNFVDHFKVS